MENINQPSTNQQTFSGYLKDPEGIAISDEKVIGSLIERFPYVQMLHAFEAKCHNDGSEFDTYLEKAALYIPDRNVLYNIIHKPEYFRTDPTEKAELIAEASSVKEDDDYAETTVGVNAEESNLSSFQEELSSDFQTAEMIIEEYEVPEDEISDNSDPATLSILEEGEQATEDQPDNKDLSESPADETEKLIISNIAASDFFRFEEKLDDQLTSHPDAERSDKSIEQNKNENSSLNSAQGVSKYNDDKMPYTFLWWLNKTRKEHSATYQPYISFKLDTTQSIKKDSAADLNQQIIENIFHLQSPLEDIKEEEKPKTVEFTIKRKDEQIVERFIREEPQIRPPRPEKLDNENKARRSSEDSYDVVSETLANVYIEQMLFHKAIDTYKKLSLRFPEKSAYFADQIRKLETTN